MAKNLIEEIKEIVQHIETNYQEGIDYEWVVKTLIEKASGGLRLKIISPKLKKFCREKFNIPFKNHLVWEIGNKEGSDFYYRINGVVDEYDSFDLAKGKIYRGGGKAEPKKCKHCGKLTIYENGRIVQWSGKKINGELPNPNIIGYFHSECGKKYFGDKEQPNQNEISRLKEKLLRNLDKICIDPLGDLANAELLKDKEIENKYYWKANYKSSEFKKIASRIYKVEIEGEEIDLEKYFFLGSEDYCELKRAIIKEIKQNLSEWKIDFSPEGESTQFVKWMVEHQSGRRHWRIGIERYWTEIYEKEKYWAEIGTALNSKFSPTPLENKSKNTFQLTLAEKETIRKYMEKRQITSLILVGNRLIAEYKDNHSEKLEINNPELQNIKKCLEKTVDNSLNYEQLGGNSNSPNQPKSPNYTPLWIILGVGGGIIIGILVGWLFKRKKAKK